MTNEYKLNPCRVCGGEPEIHGEGTCACAVCMVCGNQTGMYEDDEDVTVAYSRAVNAWNVANPGVTE
jgi:hypothetical protein